MKWFLFFRSNQGDLQRFPTGINNPPCSLASSRVKSTCHLGIRPHPCVSWHAEDSGALEWSRGRGGCRSKETGPRGLTDHPQQPTNPHGSGPSHLKRIQATALFWGGSNQCVPCGSPGCLIVQQFHRWQFLPDHISCYLPFSLPSGSHQFPQLLRMAVCSRIILVCADV